MTGSWVPLYVAIRRIREVTGRPVFVKDVHRLGGDDGPLTVEWLHDHYGVLESSLAAYLTDLSASELATPSGDVLAEHADKPTVGRWSRAEDPDAFDDRADHDTPNDEGDDQQ